MKCSVNFTGIEESLLHIKLRNLFKIVCEVLLLPRNQL